MLMRVATIVILLAAAFAQYGTVSLPADVGTSVKQTGLFFSVPTTSLCTPSQCPAGLYNITYHIASRSACATPGSAGITLTISYTDDDGAHSFGNAIPLGVLYEAADEMVPLRSAGTAAITYSVNYAGCTSGTGTYGIYLQPVRVQ
jgi:hypothetical protein